MYKIHIIYKYSYTYLFLILRAEFHFVLISLLFYQLFMVKFVTCNAVK